MNFPFFRTGSRLVLARLARQAATTLFLLVGFVAVLSAKTISFEEGHVTFNAPDDFTPLTQAEIDAKFPMQNSKAMNVIGNANRAVSISYALTQNAVQPAQLGDLKDALTAQFGEMIPNAEWIKNDYVDLNGKRWIIFEFISPGAGVKIHNIEILTSYRGAMLAFNFNAAQPDFDANADHLRACLRSVTIKDDSKQLDAPTSNAVPVSADEEVARGQKALRQGLFDLAHEAFTAALLLEPGKAAAVEGLKQVDAAQADQKKDTAPATTDAAK